MSYLKSKGFEDIRTNPSVFRSVAGTETTVLFEFTVEDENGKPQTLFIFMDSLVTISLSVSRAKIPVSALGNASMTGVALGSKMVAGTCVKTVLVNDELYKALNEFEKRKIEITRTLRDYLPTSAISYGAGYKDKDKFKYLENIMLDDIHDFNIHIVSIPEYGSYNAYNSSSEGPVQGNPRSFPMYAESIIGATIINTGKIYSVENLITEATFSFMAKNVVSNYDIFADSKSFATGNTNNKLTGSQLVRQRKKRYFDAIKVESR